MTLVIPVKHEGDWSVVVVDLESRVTAIRGDKRAARRLAAVVDAQRGWRLHGPAWPNQAV
jgi:hypothetical protein